MYNTQEMKHMSEYSQASWDTVRAARKKLGLLQSQAASLIGADKCAIIDIDTYRANTTMDVFIP